MYMCVCVCINVCPYVYVDEIRVQRLAAKCFFVNKHYVGNGTGAYIAGMLVLFLCNFAAIYVGQLFI